MKRLFELEAMEPLDEAALRALEQAMRESEEESHDNDAIATGYTYLGQFIDHDITHTSTPTHGTQALTGQAGPRSPQLDLDSLYGGGPGVWRDLYEPTNEKLFRWENRNPTTNDLPRNGEGIAIVGDPRNDENVIIGQLTLSLLKLHNKVVADLPDDATFEEAQRRVQWHYQWIVVEDFLRTVADPAVLADRYWREEGEARIELRHYRPGADGPHVPIEFSFAGFRFGHSMVRSRYDLNRRVKQVRIFDTTGLPDLRGERRLTNGWMIEWAEFFGEGAQRSHLIDALLSPRLFHLPVEEGSLPYRDLVSGQEAGLPSGQDVAKAVGSPSLSDEELGGAPNPTPLWFYLLKESEVRAGGRHLGVVASTIVAEVLLGLLAHDPESWYSQDPTWEPDLGSTIAELLSYATS
jgi:hypothetical protein